MLKWTICKMGVKSEHKQHVRKCTLDHCSLPLGVTLKCPARLCFYHTVCCTWYGMKSSWRIYSLKWQQAELMQYWSSPLTWSFITKDRTTCSEHEWGRDGKWPDLLRFSSLLFIPRGNLSSCLSYAVLLIRCWVNILLWKSKLIMDIKILVNNKMQ